MTALRLAELRTIAEQQVEPVIKALDRENAWKMRDEVLGFRRRFRLFANSPVEPYLTHMRATDKILPEYVEYMRQHPQRFSKEETARCERLGKALAEMLQIVDKAHA